MLTVKTFWALVPFFVTLLCWSASADAADIALLVDNSVGMQRADPEKQVGKMLHAHLDELEADDRASLFLYGGDTLLIRPLDSISAAESPVWDRLDKRLNYSSRRSNAAAGLERAIHELTRMGSSDKRRVLIWISGSEIDTGIPEQDKKFDTWVRRILAQEAAKSAIEVSVIAMGVEDQPLPRFVSQYTAGRYLFIADPIELGGALNDLLGVVASDLPVPSQAHAVARNDLTDMESATKPFVDQSDVTPPRDDPAPGYKGTALMDETSEQRQMSGSPLPETEGQKSAASLTESLAVAGLVLAIAVILAGVWYGRRHRNRHKSPSAQPGKHRALLKDVDDVSGQFIYDISEKSVHFSQRASLTPNNVVQIVIDREVVSHEHASIEYREAGYWIRDRGSRNGTFVNGDRVTDDLLLKHGDLLRLAGYQFEFGLQALEQSGSESSTDAEDQSATRIFPNPADETTLRRVAEQSQAQTQEVAGQEHEEVTDTTLSTADLDLTLTRPKVGDDNSVTRHDNSGKGGIGE